MKGFVFLFCLILAVTAERLWTLGRRMFWSARRLLVRIFLPAPAPTWGVAPGSPTKARLRALRLARLARSERVLAGNLGRYAKLVFRLGSPEFARQIAWDAYDHWKLARRARLLALRALQVEAR